LLESNLPDLRDLAMPLSFALAVAAGAYLIGSFPSGYIVGRINGVDLRKVGSGNIGATNALRVLGKKWGYLVFAADILKGWLSVTLAYALSRQFAPDQVTIAGIFAAVFAVLGHNFPVWLAFKGGKGIATSAGIMIALFPIWVFLCALVVWVGSFQMTRYVSVASILAAISLSASTLVLALLGRCDWLLVVVAFAMTTLAVWRHKSNIDRLLAGTEKKFERRTSSSGT
jgi:acyl phosphate:glycerol-3-phosphate acyltransferase